MANLYTKFLNVKNLKIRIPNGIIKLYGK